jgi:hypothetical protein
MDLGLIVVPAFFALIFLAFFGLTWWTSHSKSYRAWELRELQRWIEEQERRPKPPWAEDPISNKIEWTGTAAWGADPSASANPKGAVVRIRSVSAGRIEFQPGSTRKFHAAMLFASAVSGILAYSKPGSFTHPLVFPLIFMSLSVMVWLFRQFTWEALVFDKQLGMYWLGKGDPPALVTGTASSHRLGRISDIHALQLITTRRFVGDPRMGAGSTSKEFPTHELVLVLRDATRHSIVVLDDYGGLDHDAKILAAFLQRPLWKPH